MYPRVVSFCTSSSSVGVSCLSSLPSISMEDKVAIRCKSLSSGVSILGLFNKEQLRESISIYLSAFQPIVKVNKKPLRVWSGFEVCVLHRDMEKFHLGGNFRLWLDGTAHVDTVVATWFEVTLYLKQVDQVFCLRAQWWPVLAGVNLGGCSANVFRRTAWFRSCLHRFTSE